MIFVIFVLVLLPFLRLATIKRRRTLRHVGGHVERILLDQRRRAMGKKMRGGVVSVRVCV